MLKGREREAEHVLTNEEGVAARWWKGGEGSIYVWWMRGAEDCRLSDVSFLSLMRFWYADWREVGGWESREAKIEGSGRIRWEGEGKEEEIVSLVLPGRMLPAPLLIFNEARRNIMEMSCNGPRTTALIGSPINTSPLFLLFPLPAIPLFLCPPHCPICLWPSLPTISFSFLLCFLTST